MDNMLYIIVGLVIVAVIAVVVMRKNKAPQTSTRSDKPTTTSSAHSSATNTIAPERPASAETVTKFDNLTVAQRFIDQQRYDKAIETLNRGLTEKPNDGPLSIKLLSVYAKIDQQENFNTVYNKIQAHNDAKTVAMADDLKDLYVGEQSPVVQPEIAKEDSNDTFDSMSLDFPTTAPVNDTTTLSDSLTLEEQDSTAINAPVDSTASSNAANISNDTDHTEDAFELTLGDLESDFNDPATKDDTPVTPLTHTNDDTLSSPNTETIEDNDISDFDFDFDSSEENVLSESSVTPSEKNQELALEDEDFVLDFDELTADADEDLTDAHDVSTTEVLSTTDDIQNPEDDFVLSLDSLDTSDEMDDLSTNESAIIEDDDMSSFILEDIEGESDVEEASFDKLDTSEVVVSENTIFNDAEKTDTFEDSTVEKNTFENDDLENQLLDYDIDMSDFEASDSTPTTFDDNILIDDNFSTDSLAESTEISSPAITSAPVETDIITEDTRSVEDFSSRFAADFDFVKSLDSNQVTLDLADQYLQLGEYDSAKRLLNEVVAYGNSEQKQRAETLLERTA